MALSQHVRLLSSEVTASLRSAIVFAARVILVSSANILGVGKLSLTRNRKFHPISQSGWITITSAWRKLDCQFQTITVTFTSMGNNSGMFLNSNCTLHYALIILIIDIRILFFETILVPKSAEYIHIKWSIIWPYWRDCDHWF